MASATGPTIFSTTYSRPNDWFDLKLVEGIVIPAMCDPAHPWYERASIFLARTCLYSATRVGELTTHLFVGIGMLFEEANRYLQISMPNGNYPSSSVLHPTLVAAANESVKQDQILAEPLVKYLYAQILDDADKISAIFNDATKTATDKVFCLLSTTTDWALLIAQIVTTQLASTIAFTAECFQEFDGAFLATDITTPAYIAAREKFLTVKSKNTWYNPYGWDPSSSNPFTTSPTALDALPVFSPAGRLPLHKPSILLGATIDYETIKADSAALKKWLIDARDYILANQAAIHPVKLQNHSNLCYYDTFFQTFIHQMIIDESFLKPTDVSNTLWNGLFDNALIDLTVMRADIIRYTMGLVQGIEKGKPQTIKLDGHVPGIPFGTQYAVSDVITALANGMESKFFPVAHGQPRPIGKPPFSLGLQPSEPGNETVHYTQLQVGRWFETERSKVVFITPKGLELLRDWVMADEDENANVIIVYESPTHTVELDLRNNASNQAFLDAIATDKKAKPSSKYKETYLTFRYEHLPDLQRPLLDEEEQEQKSFHALHHPLLQGADFELAVARALAESYTHDNITIPKDLDKIPQRIAAAGALEDLNPLFMQHHFPSHEDCLDEDSWDLMHEKYALFRIQVEREDKSLLPQAEVTKPELSFEMRGKHFDFVSCSFHTGSLSGGHWTALRKEGTVYWRIDDCGGNSPISENDLQDLLNNNGPKGQIREVMYEVTDIDLDDDALEFRRLCGMV